MILVIGGMAQGKRAFVERTLLPERSALIWTDGETAGWTEFLEAGLCCNFHLLLRRLLEGRLAPEEEWARRWREEAPAERLAALLKARRPDRILVADEIGCGIVPMDARERRWREETGRVCCCLAAEAEQVWRVCCGVGQRIR